MIFSKRPDTLGVRQGRLAPCKPSPNCVSSQSSRSDAQHYIEPIQGTMDEVRRAVRASPRATIVTDESNYVHAEFRTLLMRYVDDVEFFFDGHVVQVRSCSRVGRSDFGVNRRRVEALRVRTGSGRESGRG